MEEWTGVKIDPVPEPLINPEKPKDQVEDEVVRNIKVTANLTVPYCEESFPICEENNIETLVESSVLKSNL